MASIEASDPPSSPAAAAAVVGGEGGIQVVTPYTVAYAMLPTVALLLLPAGH